MMSRKRGAVLLAERDTSSCSDSHFNDTSSSKIDQASRGKRCCGSADHTAVGALTQGEVAAFVSRLLGVQMPMPPAGLTAQELQQLTGLSYSGWQAFAELNDLLGRNWHLLSSSQLRGYHSFTCQDRASLWNVYAAANGLSSTAAALAGMQSALPCHLRLVKHLLEYVLSSYPQASLTKYTMSIPPWAVGWAARWSWSSSEMTLLILQAYRPVDPSSSNGSRRPMCRLFVPMLL